jgi:hypothetical protein
MEIIENDSIIEIFVLLIPNLETKSSIVEVDE